MARFAGNTVAQFMSNANAKFGDSSLGETNAHPAFKTFRFKDGKLSNVAFVCPIDLDYAERGGGSPDAANKKAIDDVAAIAKTHELKHEAGYEAAFKTWNPTKVAKDLMSATYPNLQAAKQALTDKLRDLEAALKAACLDLHKKEGIVLVTTDANGAISIAIKPAGASGCT